MGCHKTQIFCLAVMKLVFDCFGSLHRAENIIILSSSPKMKDIKMVPDFLSKFKLYTCHVTDRKTADSILIYKICQSRRFSQKILPI